MPTITYSGGTLEVDEDGYLVDPGRWDKDIARVLAEREGIPKLTDDMLDILTFMREYYTKFNAFPVLRAVCKNVHQEKECVYHRFPDPIKAWKIAGLPQPTTEVLSLIRHEVEL